MNKSDLLQIINLNNLNEKLIEIKKSKINNLKKNIENNQIIIEEINNEIKNFKLKNKGIVNEFDKKEVNINGLKFEIEEYQKLINNDSFILNALNNEIINDKQDIEKIKELVKEENIFKY